MAISSNPTGLRPGVCTSTTRPTAPYEGQMIYETDTDIVYIWDNSTWVRQFNANIVDSKGDLIVGTANDTIARLGVGSNNQVLVADSGQSSGVKWGYPAGSVLQVVQGTYSSQIGTTSTAFVDTGLTASITPKSTSSRIFVSASFGYYHTGGKMATNIVRGSTQILLTNPFGNDGGNPSDYTTMTIVDSPSTTSSTAYKVQYRNTGGGTAYFAHSNCTCTIILMEIAG